MLGSQPPDRQQTIRQMVKKEGGAAWGKRRIRHPRPRGLIVGAKAISRAAMARPIPARASHTPATSAIPMVLMTARNSTGWPSQRAAAGEPAHTLVMAREHREDEGLAVARPARAGSRTGFLSPVRPPPDVGLELRARRPFVVQGRRGHLLARRGPRQPATGGPKAGAPPTPSE